MEVSVTQHDLLAVLATLGPRGFRRRSVYVTSGGPSVALIGNLDFHLLFAAPQELEPMRLHEALLRLYGRAQYAQRVVDDAVTKRAHLREQLDAVAPGIEAAWRRVDEGKAWDGDAELVAALGERREEVAALFEQVERAALRISLLRRGHETVYGARHDGEPDHLLRTRTSDAYFLAKAWTPYVVPRGSRIAPKLVGYRAWRLTLDNHQALACLVDELRRPLLEAGESYRLHVLQADDKRDVAFYRGAGAQYALGQTIHFPRPTHSYEWSFGESLPLRHGILLPGAGSGTAAPTTSGGLARLRESAIANKERMLATGDAAQLCELGGAVLLLDMVHCVRRLGHDTRPAKKRAAPPVVVEPEPETKRRKFSTTTRLKQCTLDFGK